MMDLNNINVNNGNEAATLTAHPLTKEEVTELLEAEKNREVMVHNELMSYRENKEWDKFVNLSLTYRNGILAEAFEYYDEVPDHLKYDWVMDAYSHTGDGIEAVCDAMIDIRKYGAPMLPEEWKDKETITIYRGGAESIDEAEEFLSWTTDKRVAFWFYRRPYLWLPKHVWKAEIRPKDILGYITSRCESEVIQYRSVMNVVDITEEATSEEGKQLANDFTAEIYAHNSRFGL